MLQLSDLLHAREVAPPTSLQEAAVVETVSSKSSSEEPPSKRRLSINHHNPSLMMLMHPQWSPPFVQPPLALPHPPSSTKAVHAQGGLDAPVLTPPDLTSLKRQRGCSIGARSASISSGSSVESSVTCLDSELDRDSLTASKKRALDPACCFPPTPTTTPLASAPTANIVSTAGSVTKKPRPSKTHCLCANPNCKTDKSAVWRHIRSLSEHALYCNACALYYHDNHAHRPLQLCKQPRKSYRLTSIPPKDRKCSNCNTCKTSLWRFLEEKLVCNACGQYFKRQGSLPNVDRSNLTDKLDAAESNVQHAWALLALDKSNHTGPMQQPLGQPLATVPLSSAPTPTPTPTTTPAVEYACFPPASAPGQMQTPMMGTMGYPQYFVQQQQQQHHVQQHHVQQHQVQQHQVQQPQMVLFPHFVNMYQQVPQHQYFFQQQQQLPPQPLPSYLQPPPASRPMQHGKPVPRVRAATAIPQVQIDASGMPVPPLQAYNTDPHSAQQMEKRALDALTAALDMVAPQHHSLHEKQQPMMQNGTMSELDVVTPGHMMASMHVQKEEFARH